MTDQILEVLRRAETGMTRPFICRGDDGGLYFVKGAGAGRPSQIREWIAGTLGLAFGLPMAPFKIVVVPEALSVPGSKLAELGTGPAFGSLMRREVMELTASGVRAVPEDIQRDVLAFDWWVRNGDRMLTERGGNPNLLWEPSVHELVVIDHNQAFDTDFHPGDFLNYHVFRGQWRDIAGDRDRRDEYNRRFSSALEGWPGIRAAIPEAWFFVDPEMTVPADFDLEAVYKMLRRHERDDFWKAL